ncbi:MAG: redoxin domain-containing protein [Planctomycetes bacterium]|nr:redoxin domain-containing protein [Planctomycetota bacterium]
MALHVGDVAPDFTLKTQDDKEWKLGDHKGKNVVLLFYPLDWSPTCEKENCSISNDQSLSFPNTVVVGVSRDSVWSHKAWRNERKIKHDLLADVKLEIAAKYGLVHPAGFISHRATVIVDKAGKVAFCQVQEKTPEARDMGAVIAALKKLG